MKIDGLLFCFLLVAVQLWTLDGKKGRTHGEQGMGILDLRLPLAGGLAGGFSNAVLFPLDTIKTMQQADPKLGGIKSALRKLQRMDNNMFVGLKQLYSGFFAAVLGSIPSSALYFGTYESAKKCLYHKVGGESAGSIQHYSRPFIHMLAAASGNVMSSVVFVPKDAIKQQLQAIKTGSIPSLHGKISSAVTLPDVLWNILKTKGVKGFYPNYRVTLMRNIPSAVIRFTVYEELRLIVQKTVNSTEHNPLLSVGYMVAGGLASAFASASTTPFDLVKTRLACGVIPQGTSALEAMKRIVAVDGFKGLFVGIQARLLMSSLFGGIGFASFELCKQKLGVVQQPIVPFIPREETRSVVQRRGNVRVVSDSEKSREIRSAGISTISSTSNSACNFASSTSDSASSSSTSNSASSSTSDSWRKTTDPRIVSQSLSRS